MSIIYRGLKEGLSTTWTLGKVIFPITLIVTILQFTPILPWIINLFEPVMGIFGLSGEAAVPLVMGNVLNLYAGIAAIISFDFTVKEVFIMAIMLSFSHNLFVESAVATKVGVKWWVIVSVRLGLATISAFIINLFWNGGSELAQYGMITKEDPILNNWGEIALHGMETAILAIVQLAMIVIPLMIVIQFMREKGWLHKLSDLLAPCMKLLGMNRNTSMTMVAGLTVGLAFGAGLMIQAVKEDGVSKRDMYLALIFLVACHAVIEDTLIFIPLGIPVWPLLLIRITAAILLTICVARIMDKKDKGETTNERTYDLV